jgi:S-adenosylmethionine-dependent methyltransferase
MKNGNFDGIANKFDRNIYGTTKGKLRHQLLRFYLDDVLMLPAKEVLDAGASTGMMAKEFAQVGHNVTLLDISSEALDIARERLSEYHSTRFVNGSLADISKSFDIILCHAVLEWLNEPLIAIEHLLSFVKPEGYLSLSFFNADAMLFNNAIYGNFDYIAKGLKVRNAVRLNPHNPQSPNTVLSFLQARDDIEIKVSAGIRCFHDYMRDVSMQSSQYDALLKLEKELGAKVPFKWMGKYFYILIRKKAKFLE